MALTGSFVMTVWSQVCPSGGCAGRQARLGLMVDPGSKKQMGKIQYLSVLHAYDYTIFARDSWANAALE